MVGKKGKYKNSMKINTPYMAETMMQAQVLQARYHYLKAAGTQNIRNPLPMRELVKTVVPVLPKPTALVNFETRTKLTIDGRDFIKKELKVDFAKSILPANYWQKHAVSKNEVFEMLTKRGFIVNKATLGVFISQAHGIQSLRVKKQVPAGHEKRGSSYKLYFIESK